MVIIFMSEKARNLLLCWGMVFTFRTIKRMKVGKDWMTDRRRGKKIADVDVEYIKRLEPSELEGQYLKYSGFETKKEWMEEIKRLHHGKLPVVGFLYKVTKLEEGES